MYSSWRAKEELTDNAVHISDRTEPQTPAAENETRQPRDYGVRERKATWHSFCLQRMEQGSSQDQQLQVKEGICPTTCKYTEFRKQTAATGH